MTAKIILEIEADAEKAAKWLEGVASSAVTDIEELLVPIFEGIEPTLLSDVKSALVTFLTTAESAGSIEDIEQDFIESLEAAGSALLAAVKTVPGPVLQGLIALVKAAL